MLPGRLQELSSQLQGLPEHLRWFVVQLLGPIVTDLAIAAVIAVVSLIAVVNLVVAVDLSFLS